MDPMRLDRRHDEAELAGVVPAPGSPGERRRAARPARSAASTRSPVDLSGEVKRFVIDHDRAVDPAPDDARRPARCWPGGCRQPHVLPVVGRRRRADAGARHRAVRPRHRRHHADPDLGRRGQRPLGGLRPGLPRSATTPTSPCSPPTRTPSASTTRSVSPGGSGADSASRILWAWMLKTHDTGSPTRRPTSPPRTIATRVACGPRQGRLHPGRLVRRAAGATARLATVVGCTLDVAASCARRAWAMMCP